jgi:hypothetical protein
MYYDTMSNVLCSGLLWLFGCLLCFQMIFRIFFVVVVVVIVSVMNVLGIFMEIALNL